MAKGKSKKIQSRDTNASDDPHLSGSNNDLNHHYDNTTKKMLLMIFKTLLMIVGGFIGATYGFALVGVELVDKNEDSTIASFWPASIGSLVRNHPLARATGIAYFVFGNQKAKIPGYIDLYQPMTRGIIDTTSSKNAHFSIIYALLREAIVREKGGYVYPDLGILQPAPSGAARGIGMVQDKWYRCQRDCTPGVRQEKLQLQQYQTQTETSTMNTTKPKTPYQQEEILIKVPLSFQMTRKVALDVLLPLVPIDVQKNVGIHELDDAALLVLLLAHERGVGKFSRWLPYLASLPPQPSCGYATELQPYMLDSIQALKEEIGLDVNGWSEELIKAGQYADKIATGLAKDYGSYLQHPIGMTATENIQWSLCQVASRATAGNQEYGSLRMVPLIDMINHDFDAGGFAEVVGDERLAAGDFLDAAETDAGAFVVRSLRHGRRKALKKGQELLVNYNVPQYSALDWFISLGFVPSERWRNWEMVNSALPRVRKDVPFHDDTPKHEL